MSFHETSDDGLDEAIEALQAEKDGEEYAGIGVTMLLKWLQDLRDNRKREERMMEYGKEHDIWTRKGDRK